MDAMAPGAALSTRMVCSEALVQAFAQATGDHSAIHMDAAFARLGRYRRRVVHGMLPVFCLLATAGGDLLEISCRFSAPAFLDDALDLSLGQADAAGWQALRVERQGTGELVTAGKVRLGPVAPASSPAALEGPAAQARHDLAALVQALAGPVEQARHDMAELAPGQSETLQIRADMQAVAPLLAIAFPHGLSQPLAASLMALLPLSTMVGMRLPGRQATFTEFSVRFDLPVATGAASLNASIDKLHASSRRIQLGLRWLQDGHEIGQGQAAVLVNAAAPLDMSSSELRANHMDLGLAGRVALVTGASRGIGAATARLLALHGVTVVVHYHQGLADAQAVVDDIAASGGRAIALGADLRDEAQVRQLFCSIADGAGPLDILVNNAVGQFSPKAFEQVTAQDLQAELDVSLLGLHACCREAVAGMRARRSGHIVNLGTVATQVPAAGQIPYIAAKSAVEGYTRALAAELAADNVQVNLVVPAMTRTSLIAALPASLVDRIAQENPQGRLLEPAEVAQAIVLLCSGWTKAVSGQQLVLNQGMAPFL